MRFAATTEPIDHPHKIEGARRKIARIHTVLKQREIEAKAKAAPATPTATASPETGKK